MIIYIIDIIVLLAVITIFIIKVKNNFDVNKIALDEADVAIESLLKKKFDLLNNTSEAVSKILNKREPIVKRIIALRSKKLDDSLLDIELNEIGEELVELAFTKRKLKKEKEFIALLDKVNDVEIQLNATKDYYNNKITIHNKYVRGFPSNLIGTIFKYKEKEYFNLKEEKTES